MSIISALLNCSKEERIKALDMLINHSDTAPIFDARVTAIVENILNNSFDARLVTSELKPIRRLAELETVTGLNDYSDFEEEEREPNIPEKINSLTERIDNINQYSVQAIKEPVVQSEGVAENRAITIFKEAKKAL